MSWLMLGGYLIGAAFTARRAMRWMADDLGGDLEVDDFVVIGVSGFIAGLVWPLVVILGGPMLWTFGGDR